MSNHLKKILIANRGEIAVRVIRACADAGIKSVAVYSECDRAAYHTRMADEAYYIGPSPSIESYLVQDKIIETAKKSGADAIHPGYGFLAENSSFAKKCEENGIIFIGPKSDTIALLGDKLEARRTALKANLPVVPGAEFDNSNLAKVPAIARKAGYPVLIKAAAGGGGKGMRIVESEEKLNESIQSAIREAGSAHVPEDRQSDGLVLPFSIRDNLVLNTYYEHPFSRGLNLNSDVITKTAEQRVEEFDVRTPSIFLPASTLSGGNQQKVIVAREFSRPIKLLIAAQPTRGLDVGSIEYIHGQIVKKRDEGCAVLLVSPELDEIMSLSDRIAVMFGGKILGIIPAKDATKEGLGLLMAGILSNEQAEVV